MKHPMFNEEHELLAEVEAVLADIPKRLMEQAAFGSDDWKVYPDEEVVE